MTHATETFLLLARRARVSYKSLGRLTDVRMVLLVGCVFGGRFVLVGIIQSIHAEFAPLYTI